METLNTHIYFGLKYKLSSKKVDLRFLFKKIYLQNLEQPPICYKGHARGAESRKFYFRLFSCHLKLCSLDVWK